MQRAGIITPDKGGNFNAHKLVTRAEMAGMIDNAFGLKAPLTDNFVDVPFGYDNNYGSISRLYTLGITTGDNGYFHPNKNLTRAHFATFIHRALNQDPNFVAGPIKKERKFKTSGEKFQDTGLLTDHYKYAYDIPLPEGETYASLKEKQEKEFNRLRVKNKTNGVGRTLITKYGNELRTTMETVSKRHFMTYKEYIDIINWTIETGEVYDGEFFVIYFSFEDGGIHTAFNNKYKPE
jgi:hypothetical protein